MRGKDCIGVPLIADGINAVAVCQTCDRDSLPLTREWLIFDQLEQPGKSKNQASRQHEKNAQMLSAFYGNNTLWVRNMITHLEHGGTSRYAIANPNT
jgi:hypothetical protein